MAHLKFVLFRYCNNQISPTEIEEILQSHPEVIEALVFGIRDPNVQERVSAVVVLKNSSGRGGDVAGKEDIVRFVNDRVNADYKKIRGEVLIRDSLPRNTSGKLLRREMRRWAEEVNCTKTD